MFVSLLTSAATRFMKRLRIASLFRWMKASLRRLLQFQHIFLIIWAIFECSASVAAPQVPWTTSRLVGSPNPPAPYTPVRQFPALSFQHPVDLALMPGSERWFLLEQGGKLFS